MGRELNPSPPQRRANALTVKPQYHTSLSYADYLLLLRYLYFTEILLLFSLVLVEQKSFSEWKLWDELMQLFFLAHYLSLFNKRMGNKQFFFLRLWSRRHVYNIKIFHFINSHLYLIQFKVLKSMFIKVFFVIVNRASSRRFSSYKVSLF